MRKATLLCCLVALLVLASCARAENAATPAPAVFRTATPPDPGGTAPAESAFTTDEPVPASLTTLEPSSAAPTELPAATATEDAPAPEPTSPTAEPGQRGGPDRRLEADEWQNLPVIPAVSPRAREIFQRGLQLGRNPHAFSKVGDCGSTPAWFLGDFDRGPRFYELGEYTALENVIAHFQGSFGRASLAAKAGFSTSSLLAPLWADREQCEANENPLACEYRLHNPSIALITLGTNDVWHADSFEPQMRQVIEYSIELGILPVLATKADNLEKDGSLNATIAQLAVEYELPLWNYWLAVQPLPDGGLQEDEAHITWGANRFNDPNAMQKGWPVRNLTALQVLDSVLQAVSEE